MKFFDSFWKPSFYKHNKENLSFWKGLGRLILISFCIGAVSSGVIYATFGKNIPAYINSFETKVIEGYPSSLIVTIKNGTLSKNTEGPVLLYPVSLLGEGVDSKSLQGSKYFVAIDDTKEATLASLNASQAIILFAKDGIISRNNNSVKVYPYVGVETTAKSEIVFSKDTMNFIIDTTNKYTGVLPLLLTIFVMVFFTVLLPLGKLMSVLFIGLLLMFMSKQIVGQKLEYQNAYILALYALPSIMIIENLVRYVPYLSGVVAVIPFFNVFAVLSFLWFMFREKITQKA